MQACLDIALPYVHQRRQFGIPIGHNQLIQAKLADMHVKLSAARAYTYAAARAVDHGLIHTRDCAGAIMFASDRAVECALDAIQCLGGSGYINELPAGRLLRDSKVSILSPSLSLTQPLSPGPPLSHSPPSHSPISTSLLTFLPLSSSTRLGPVRRKSGR